MSATSAAREVYVRLHECRRNALQFPQSFVPALCAAPHMKNTAAQYFGILVELEYVDL